STPATCRAVAPPPRGCRCRRSRQMPASQRADPSLQSTQESLASDGYSRAARTWPSWRSRRTHMTRIAPIDLATAAKPVADQLAAAERQLGMVPTLFRVVAHAPAALDGLLALSAALARGTLPARTRETIALAVAELDRCDYCLSAHTALGARAGMTPAQI